MKYFQYRMKDDITSNVITDVYLGYDWRPMLYLQTGNALAGEITRVIYGTLLDEIDELFPL